MFEFSFKYLKNDLIKGHNFYLALALASAGISLNSCCMSPCKVDKHSKDMSISETLV